LYLLISRLMGHPFAESGIMTLVTLYVVQECT
jgi:hypothetical protein